MDLAFSSGLPLHSQGGFTINRLCTNSNRVARLSTGKSRAILDTAPVTNVPDEEKNGSTERVSVAKFPEMLDATRLGKGTSSFRDEKFGFDTNDVDYDVEDDTETEEEEEEEEDDDDGRIEDDLEQIDLEEEDDDPLLVSKASSLDDFEDDDVELTEISNGRIRKPRRKPARRDVTLTGMDIDSNDDIVDEEDELLEVDSDLLGIENNLSARKSKIIVPGDGEEGPTSSDLLIDEDFDDPSEAELQSAAEMLTGTGLLGRATSPDDEDGDESRSKKVGSKGKKAPRGRKPKEPALNFEEEEEDELVLDKEQVESNVKKPLGLDGYSDSDEEEEAEFTLISNTEGSFGRVWELNEDSYITITEPGQTYAYELDDIDLDDQEMSSIRRGSQGGWGSGLQNDAKNKYRKGSREWIARRSYDLISKATPREMRMWTKRQEAPPDIINNLYPEPAGPQAIIGVAEMNATAYKSEVMPGNEYGGKDEKSRRTAVAKDGNPSDSIEDGSGNAQARSALERAVKFPCAFKFKVEGTGGEGLIASLMTDVLRVLNQELPRSAFTEEPSGRYTRVIFSVEVAEARHVTDLYDAFRQNPLVKFSYG